LCITSIEGENAASIEIGNMPCRMRTVGIILSMMVAPIAISMDQSKSDLKALQMTFTWIWVSQGIPKMAGQVPGYGSQRSPETQTSHQNQYVHGASARNGRVSGSSGVPMLESTIARLIFQRRDFNVIDFL